jgi:hypothetical protein
LLPVSKGSVFTGKRFLDFKQGNVPVSHFHRKPTVSGQHGSALYRCWLEQENIAQSAQINPKVHLFIWHLLAKARKRKVKRELSLPQH